MRKTLFGMLLLLVCVFHVLSAEENSGPMLNTKLTTISLFKNGLGFVSRQGELPRGDATVILNGLPEVVHGTLRAYSTDGAEVRSIIASQSEKVESTEAIDISELLEANQGLSVEAENCRQGNH
jgi:hypothetical protein